MDRFIETYLINPLLKNQNLKSNMDRFIAKITNDVSRGLTYLKSNMDRFIGRNKNTEFDTNVRFKIQYG